MPEISQPFAVRQVERIGGTSSTRDSYPNCDAFHASAGSSLTLRSFDRQYSGVNRNRIVPISSWSFPLRDRFAPASDFLSKQHLAPRF